MNTIKPIFLSTERRFRFKDGDEWASQYCVFIGDDLRREFSFKKMRYVPSMLGYYFWFVTRSKGYLTIDDNLGSIDLQKALVLDVDSQKLVNLHLESKINSIGEVSWRDFTTLTGEYLDISDVADDAGEPYQITTGHGKK